VALKLGALNAIIGADDRPLEQGLGRAKSKFGRFGNQMESDAAETAKAIGDKLGDGVVRGADGRLRDGSGRFIKAAEDVGGRAGERGATAWSARFGDRLNQVAAGIGAAAAVALAAGIAGAMNLDAAQTRLEAQLGNTEYAAEMGAIAGRVYARGFGESAQQIGDAVRAVLKSGIVSEDSSDEVIEALTVKVQALAQTFDVDVTAAARAAGQMIRNGLAKDGTEAMDILTRAFQQTGDQAGDLLDTYSEYSVQFRKLGLDGQTATGLLIQGLKAGARDVDTVADAIKEFSIRAIDGSKTSADGFKALGLNASQMTAQIAKGGAGAQKGLDTVLDRLRAMKDPVERDAAAVALFGTKAEDLGQSLYALDTDTASDRLGNVAGAAQKMGDTMEQSASQKLESFKRSAQAALVEQVAKAIPHIESLAKWMGENRAIVEPLAAALGALAVVIGVIVAVTKVWTIVQTALNVVMAMNPVGLIVLAIIALVAGIVLLWTKSEAFRKFWIAVWEGIKTAAIAVWDFLVAAAKLWWATFSGFWTGVGKFFKGLWNGIVDGVKAAWNWITKTFDRVVDFVGGLPKRLSAKARGMWDGIKSAFKSAVNWIIGRWNGLSFRIPGISVPGLGQVWGGATLSTPDLPYLASGGQITQAGLAMVGERGREAVYLPEGASVIPNRAATAATSSAVHGELRISGELRARGSDLVLVLRDRAQITPGGIVALVDGR
jgi:TP901 family phage tail tape measure protein